MIKTVEHTTRTFGGKELPVTITKIIGRDTYTKPDGTTVEADEYIEFDYGPKLGVARSYGIYPQPVSPEEQAKIKAELSQMFGRLAVGL